MPNRLLRITTYILIIISVNTANAQSFGFGCLGLAGFYAGVSEYKYDTPGINDYANSFSALLAQNSTGEWKDIKFNRGTGYRIGTNFFRARWDHLFLSAKGYYQFVKEEQSNIVPTVSGQTEMKYQLTMNHWGVGVDFGVPLFSILDWKIIEADASFFTSDFTYTMYQDNKFVMDNRFTPDKIRIGYFIGTGLILNLIPDYLSVEGTAGFNFLQIDKYSGNGDAQIPVLPSSKNAVENGGWSGTIQINVGFPL
jgi:hypothetical protein